MNPLTDTDTFLAENTPLPEQLCLAQRSLFVVLVPPLPYFFIITSFPFEIVTASKDEEEECISSAT